MASPFRSLHLVNVSVEAWHHAVITDCVHLGGSCLPLFFGFDHRNISPGNAAHRLQVFSQSRVFGTDLGRTATCRPVLCDIRSSASSEILGFHLDEVLSHCSSLNQGQSISAWLRISILAAQDCDANVGIDLRRQRTDDLRVLIPITIFKLSSKVWRKSEKRPTKSQRCSSLCTALASKAVACWAAQCKAVKPRASRAFTSEVLP